jgi:hypothetical protein
MGAKTVKAASRIRRRTALVLILLVGMATTTACIPAPELRLYNNTDSQISVFGCQAGVKGTCAFVYAAEFSVEVGNRTYSYALPDDLRWENHADWVEQRLPATVRIKMQIENDGRIFILPASAAGPQPPASLRQRAGFPVVPRMTK